MNRATSACALAVLLLIASASSIHAEDFPPGLRLRDNSAWWTSTSKLCDTVWADMKIELGKATLSEEVASKLGEVRSTVELARIRAGSKLGDAASVYYCTRRGKIFRERFDSYGSKLKYKDMGVIQNALSLTEELAVMLAKGTTEGLEELIMNRTMALTASLRLRGELDPDQSARFLELAGELAGNIFAMIKAGPDLAEVRKVFEGASKAAVDMAVEFYLVAPGSADIFLYTDQEGRKWLRFTEDPGSPFAGKDFTEGITIMAFEQDADKTAEALTALREAEATFKTATVTGITKIMDVLPAELKEKVRAIAKPLGV